MTTMELWQRAQRGWPESYPVAQFPNAPLLVAIGGLAVAAATEGDVRSYARAVFYAGLTVWAWEEATDGANALRRGLGAAGLVYVVAKVGAAL
jgi:hypothetical protein